MKDSSELNDDQAAIINKLKFRSHEGKESSSFSVDVQTHDKVKALHLLGLHLNLWKNVDDGSEAKDRGAESDAILDAISKLKGDK